MSRFREWQCPWCGQRSYRFVTRPRVANPTWHRFSTRVLACPQCGQPVKTVRPAWAWAVLLLPVAGAFLVEPLFGLTFRDGNVVMGFIVAFVVAVAAFDHLARVEKETLLQDEQAPAHGAAAREATAAGRALSAAASIVQLAALAWGLLALLFVIIGAATRTDSGAAVKEEDALVFLGAGFVMGLPAWIVVAAISFARRRTTSLRARLWLNAPGMLALALFLWSLGRALRAA